MFDRNFFIGLISAIGLIVVYNIYYEAKFGDYLIRQQEKAALEKAEKDLLAAGGKEMKLQPVDPGRAGEPETAGEPAVPGAPVVPGEPAVPGEAAAPSVEEVASVPAAPQLTGSADMDMVRGDEKFINISNGVMNIALSSKGAVPVKFELADYYDDKRQRIDIWFNSHKFDKEQAEAEQEAKESNDQEFKRIKTYPTLGLKFPRDAFSDLINNATFTPDTSVTDINLTDTGKPFTVKYSLNDASGVVVTKIYTFYPNDYKFDFEVAVKSTEQYGEFDYSLVFFGLGDEESELASLYSYNGPIVMIGADQRIAEAPEEDERVREYRGDIRWAALAHRYFTAFGVPAVSKDSVVTTSFIDDLTSTLEWGFKASLAGKPEVFKFYVGPKTYSILEQQEEGITTIINFGWFDIIAKPMFWLMARFYDWTQNWGWSIILLTVVVKIIFFPLTQKGFKSMQKLQKLQPHMKKLQEAYKDDRDKLNQELLALYREHKVNPVGGCMPMILQIPIFFALYKVLLESIELKGAEWILWITDLSQADPYYVTPVLMGISMLLQQMMTPKTGDPLQRKMMMALPVVFTIMFLTFPSGLVVYWLVNNILTIGQQWIIYRDQGENKEVT